MNKTSHECQKNTALENGLAGDCLKLIGQIARSNNRQVDRWPKPQIQNLLKRGWVEMKETELALTDKGRTALRREKLKREEIRLTEKGAIGTQVRGEKVPYNRARGDANVVKTENPLHHLANRRKADGSCYLTGSQLEAGERLCSDFDRGQLVKTLGINWQRLGQSEGAVSKNARRANAGPGFGDVALDAQDRFRAALKYVGEEFADPLIDFCCFQKGLEEMERTRNWPARSAKLVLSLALARLARHYGLFDEVTGPARSAMRRWGTKDYRPSLLSSDES
ncbi:hypothetical protein SAMN04488056_101316 [Cohaesibacter marisflavi]|uniref:DUF6456 domain-containing protein n=1 Tax=Cohaesibacter marisflavi TaxID=655353 RepID=A0A1I5A273_9HYPH|nr:DUF6456 domain-containing protein [Cohaesibacter marisflavi]SFN56498.1 hypothetical protein SAMN04488056_101316 [Cohaesibacter marisflavi]